MKSNKKYKVILFDWDGTAVKSRKDPVDEVLPLLRNLLRLNVVLVVVSGTTYENIAEGKLHEMIGSELTGNFYMGLGRGAHNYSFDENGNPVLWNTTVPNKDELIKIHEFCFELHKYLLLHHDIHTDIVFSRPNYCKIDLLVEHDRGEHMYLKGGELEMIDSFLADHNFNGGIGELMDKTQVLCDEFGIALKPTTDAKYLEIGPTTKADNVSFFLEHLIQPMGIEIGECVFWGDEFGYIGPMIKGSDAEMIIPKMQEADFFDVNQEALEMPPQVKSVGGGVSSFLEFLQSQINLHNNT